MDRKISLDKRGETYQLWSKSGFLLAAFLICLLYVQIEPSSVTGSISGTVKAAGPLNISGPRIRKKVSVSVSPRSATVQTQQSQSFTATVQNDAQNKGVTWTLSGAGCSGTACGTLSATSSASGTPITYTAPAQVPSSTVSLTASSVADPTKSASASITVTAPAPNISVTISPKRGGLPVSQTLNFTAVVQNDSSNMGVSWSTSGGTLINMTSTSATYQAPSAPGVYQITATSVADPSRSASATLGVTDLTGVTTYHNDLARDGANLQEYALTPPNVAAATFGKLFSCPVDAVVYAQPLWIPGLLINGQAHNVIFVATSHDTVYAFDADASPCFTYWSKQLIPTGETWLSNADLGGYSIQPDLGIVGTPVIDPSTNILYVVARTKNQGTNCTPSANCHQRLHAIRLSDGSEASSGSAEISSSITVPGNGSGSTTVAFDTLRENQRPGLALVNDFVLLGWGSQDEVIPWHGWLIGFNKSNLQAAPVVYNTTPNGSSGGIWMGGAAPAADSSGNIFFATGNGTFTVGDEYGDSIVKLGYPVNGAFAVLDYFTPTNQFTLDNGDVDLGSGGVLLLPDLPPGAPHPHLLVQVGKEGKIYLVDRDTGRMGGYCNGCSDNVVQELPGAVAGVWGMPAFWNNTIYTGASRGGPSSSDPMKAFPFNVGGSGLISTSPSSTTSQVFIYPAPTPSVSASGTTNGIVWALDNNLYGPPCCANGPTVLHAYDATNLGNELWNSSQVAADQAGNAVKFTVPTVANGKVYVGTATEISVYGLKPN